MNIQMDETELPDRSETMECSVARAVEVLGDPWSFLVLRELFFGVRRFEEMQRHIGIARTSLSLRLTHLTEQGVLERRQYSNRPPRFEYKLTKAGLDFYPTIVALLQWGDKWALGPNGPPLLLFHRPCGSPLSAQLRCSSCLETIDAREVRYEPGPGAGQTNKNARVATRKSSRGEVYLRGRHCSVAPALQIIGDRWTFLILREAFFGSKKFESFQRHLGIARNILTQRMQRLVIDGVFTRRLYQTRPSRYEYVLTEKGVDFYPSCLLMLRWSDTWRYLDSGPPLVLRHAKCNRTFQPLMVCSHCGREIDPREVDFRDGPGA